MKSALTFSAFAILSTQVPGVSFDEISLWTGNGAHRAAFVVDFNDGQTPRSYVWGYRWDGIATGESMLRAIDTADGSLEFDLDFFGSFGYSLNAARYLPVSGGFRHSQAFSEVTERYWAYWSSTEGSSTWQFSSLGMSQRTLVDGSVDGWVFSNPGYVATSPSPPVPAVPEPATILALSVGLTHLGRRRVAGRVRTTQSRP